MYVCNVAPDLMVEVTNKGVQTLPLQPQSQLGAYGVCVMSVVEYGV